ncbi:MAG: hypothetical protein Q8928_10275 [Bacteroidota bacterium]|nr:hypothetical protein [Bacteroidota bacterium]
MKAKYLVVHFFLSVAFYTASAQMQDDETVVNHVIYKGTFVVGGNKDTYYPVIFKYGNQDRINHLRIFRGYYEAGPNELSPTHKGGLTLEFDLNYGGWGGSTYDWRIMDLRQTYHETFANAGVCMFYMGFAVWLRGGGFVYHYESECPSNLQVAYANEMIYQTPYPDHPEYTVYADNPVTVINKDNINNHLLSLSFSKQGNDILYLQGNVGIGTTAPQNKLDVNGTIRAKEIKVTLEGWSDFVFERTYKLQPLTEVEQYINKNGHLPEVPSETEVKQKGVDVGDMQAKLLQKVEELTLYSIAQEKENAELKQRLYEQELKLKKLEELIINKIN